MKIALKKSYSFGVTLIETVVVVGILSILAVFSVENIVQFQKDSLAEANANEFVSTLRLARNKSMSGEIPSGSTFEDFEEEGLAEYGVGISANSYFLFRDYQLLGEANVTRETIDTFSLSEDFSLSPTGEVNFERINGISGPFTFILSYKSVEKKDVFVNSEGNINTKNHD